MKAAPWLAAGALLAASPLTSAPGGAVLKATARNQLDLARPQETVELAIASLSGLAAADLPRVRVREQASGREVLAQAVDLDADGRFDQLVFQADFGPRESKSFLLEVGEPHPPRKEDFRVYGRFVRERHDDFAWENDRIAHRVYGAALETWDPEPLTSSGVDVWCKRTRRLVVNDWYLTGDYHRDQGEGADLYSVGRSRGCGGSGVWQDGRLFSSRNFRSSRVLANGPLRLIFELDYEPWEAGGISISEVKRITVDAGSNLHRFQSAYRTYRREGPSEVGWAAGIKRLPAASVRLEREQGWLRTWEPLPGDNGHLGCGVVTSSPGPLEVAEADGNQLVLGRSAPNSLATYYAGAGWDRSGDFPTVADWDRYLDEFARRVRSPLQVEVTPR